MQRTQNTQNNIEKLGNSQFQNLLYNYNNQDSLVLAQRQIHPTNIEYRPKISPHICDQFIFDKVTKIT